MEKISHVKSYFWIKIFLFPIFIVYYLITTFLLFYSTRKYKNHTSTTPAKVRNQKFYSWLRDQTFIKNVDYIFINENNILKSQSLFLINQSIGWNTFFIFARIFARAPTIEYACFMPETKKTSWHYLFGFSNIFYELGLVNVLIKNKFSIVSHFDFELLKEENNQKVKFSTDDEPTFKSIIENNYLPIIPVSVVEIKKFLGKKIIVKFGKAIKPYNLFDIDKKSIINKISTSF